jgi:Secretion system C-terminal sorting domain
MRHFELHPFNNPMGIQVGHFLGVANTLINGAPIFRKGYYFQPSNIVNFFGNSKLTNLNALDSVKQNLNETAKFNISNNPNLTDCTWICRLKAAGHDLWKVNMSDNPAPCNNATTVINTHGYCLITSEGQVQIKKKQVLVYPNPTNDQFYIQIDPEIKAARVKIFNSAGILLHEAILSGDISQGFSVDNFNPGLLFVHVFDKTGKLISTEKVVKY